MLNLKIMKTYCLEATLGKLDDQNLFGNLLTHFWESLKFAVSVSFEAISTEMNTLFTSLLHNTIYLSAYTSWLNYMFIMYSIGVGSSVIIRTRTSYLIGKDQKQAAKRFFFWNVGIHIVFGFIISVF